MTITEAYVLFDLPEGTDIQQVRARFSEQYSEYRMQIENAPTPNLRHRYEQNLALREEAFHLITGGASLDDSHDLPSSAPYEQENYFGSEEQTKFNKATSDKGQHNNMLLADALAFLGMQESSTPAQIKTAYDTQKTEMEAEYQKARIETVKQAYQTELNNLEQTWAVIEPWFQNKINQPKQEEDQRKRLIVAISQHEKKWTRFKTLAFVGVAVVVFAIGGLFYFLKKSAPDEITSSTIDFTALVKSADEQFMKKQFQQALETYKKALSLQPNDSSLLLRITRSTEELNLQSKSITQAITEKKENQPSETKIKVKKEVEKNIQLSYSGKNWKKKYTEVSDFRDGLYMVTLRDKNGFADESGNIVIPIIYDSVDWFQNTIRVRLKSDWFYIDKNGNRLDDDNHSY